MEIGAQSANVAVCRFMKEINFRLLEFADNFVPNKNGRNIQMKVGYRSEWRDICRSWRLGKERPQQLNGVFISAAGGPVGWQLLLGAKKSGRRNQKWPTHSIDKCEATGSA